MKHLFLINPVAGRGKNEPMIRSAAERFRDHYSLQEGTDFEIKVSQKPGDITAWVRQAAETGQELRVYACGGDGTLNEAVNGAAGFSNVALTNVPCGSGNDFLRQFSDPKAFCHILRYMDNPDEVEVDLIRCDEKYAINVCSLGLDARIGTGVTTYKKLPLVKGHGAYLLSSLVNTIKGVHHPYRVEVNGETMEGAYTMICVCSGAWYGGGFHPIPEADPSDGKLDVLLVTGVSRLKVLSVIGPYKEGRFREFPELIRYLRTDRIRVSCQQPEPVNLDGEKYIAQTAEFTIAPQKLRFFHPKTAKPLWKLPVTV